MKNMYTKKVLENYKNPHNRGKMKDPDGTGEAGAPCGDFTTVFIKVGKKNGKKILKKVMFETVGCIAAVATASLVTKAAEGKTLEEAEKLTKDQILKELGGLPEIKMHCSALATDALKKAIKNYKEKEIGKEQKLKCPECGEWTEFPNADEEITEFECPNCRKTVKPADKVIK